MLKRGWIRGGRCPNPLPLMNIHKEGEVVQCTAQIVHCTKKVMQCIKKSGHQGAHVARIPDLEPARVRSFVKINSRFNLGGARRPESTAPRSPDEGEERATSGQFAPPSLVLVPSSAAPDRR